MSARIAISNEVLSEFSSIRIEQRTGGWFVRWKNTRGNIVEKAWRLARGSSDYPVWYRQFPHGGTSCRALAQLIRWCKGQPVQPLNDWYWWASERVALLHHSSIHILKAAGYPETVPCVLCGEEFETQGGWWNLNGVSGPCCSRKSGCRQKARPTK